MGGETLRLSGGCPPTNLNLTIFYGRFMARSLPAGCVLCKLYLSLHADPRHSVPRPLSSLRTSLRDSPAPTQSTVSNVRHGQPLAGIQASSSLCRCYM